MQVTDRAYGDREHVKLVDAYYEMRGDGYDHPMPIIHVTGVTPSGGYTHVPIEGFRPYFCVPTELVDGAAKQELANDHRVLGIADSHDSVTGDDLTKVVLHTPYHTPDVRETFERTYEADVQFIERFQIDTGIKQAFSYPDRDFPVHVSDIQPADDHPVRDVPPRRVFFDIEVETTPDGPAVVSESGTKQARNRIFAIAATPPRSSGAHVWLLTHEQWDTRLQVDGVTICDTEHELLSSFVTWLSRVDTTLLSGWNSQSFDVPYLINRCRNREVSEIYDLSPTGDVREMDGEGTFYNSDLKGILLLDLMAGYKKINYKKLESYSLAAVADAELDDYEKLAVDEQALWPTDPERVIEYVRRDAELLPQINDAAVHEGTIL